MFYVTSENILFIGSILIFCSILVSRASSRFGIPALLLFLIVGMLFGSDGLGIVFNDVNKANFIGMVALCIILFTGGMETKLSEIRPVLGPGLVLSTLGVLLTAAITGGFIYLMNGWKGVGLGLPLVSCLLLAATMSSTDSATVFAMLRGKNMRLKNNLQPMLELESGSNDPMAYIITVVLIEIATSLSGGKGLALGVSAEMVQEAGFTSIESYTNYMTVWNAIKVFLLQFIVGGAVGIGIGYATVWLLNKVQLNNTPLYAIMLLSIVFFAYSLAGMLSGNGYLAVYIAGILIGNSKFNHRKQILAFLDGLTWMMQIGMFLLLGLLVNPIQMLRTAPVAILIGVFIMLVARPAAVFGCLIPYRNISPKSKLFVSWVGLKGATPIIFATYPILSHIEGGDIIFNIVFFITLMSLVIQGGTLPLVAKWLKLNDESAVQEKEFDVDLPEEAGDLTETTLTEDMVKDMVEAGGTALKDLSLPDGVRVLMIKRDGKFIVPTGTTELQVGDHLLIISESTEDVGKTVLLA